MKKKYLLGVGFSDLSREKILEYIVSHCKNQEKKWYVVTPNPEILVLAQKNPAYKNAINNATLASVDGIGIVMAGKLLGKTLPQRFSGVDLVQTLCKEVVRKPITVGFLGGRGKVAELAAKCLQEQYPGLKVGFAVEELSQLNAVNILFVAFGSPKQELFISQHLEELPCTVAIGVGGSFDMISGVVPRAPRVLQTIGFEWLFRLVIQPWRFKRQLRLLTFLLLVVKARFFGEGEIETVV